MNETFEGMWAAIVAYLPNLLAALGVLIIGWLLALLIASVIRKLLHKTTLDDRIANWISDTTKQDVNSEKVISRVIFWILMIVVLVAFFQVLGLTYVTEPLNNFLNQITEFIPRLLGAAFLLALAWLLATAARLGVEKGLHAIDLDRRLGASVDDDDSSTEVVPTTATTADPVDRAPAAVSKPARGPSLAKSLSDTVYWLIFLLFLPLILDVLALDGLLDPVNSLVDKVLAFLPNILAAALIIGLGWLVARIIRRIVTNLLAAAGLDRLGTRVGMDRVLGSQSLSQVVGLIVYVLVLIPVLIAGLNALQIEAVTEPASDMLNTMMAALPRLFAAGILLALAWVVAKVVGSLVGNLLSAIGFDRVFERLGFKTTPPSAPQEPKAGEQLFHPNSPSGVVATIVVIVVMLFASIEALRLLEFEALAALLAGLTVFLGKVALGILVFAAGLYLADLAARTIRATGLEQANLLSTLARAAIIVLATAMALRQMDVADDIINMAFGLTLGALAVAAAIAFGLGGRDFAHRYLERLDQSVRARSTGGSSGPGTPGTPRTPRDPNSPPLTSGT